MNEKINPAVLRDYLEALEELTTKLIDDIRLLLLPKDPYADKNIIMGANVRDASGNNGIENRKNPYPPIFNRTPARITEPAVGASTCASGNQVWTGHIGTLTANDAKNASQSQV